MVSAIGKTLLSTSSVLSVLENYNQCIYGLNWLAKLDTKWVCSREPVRLRANCHKTIEAFSGSKQLNPFHFRKKRADFYSKKMNPRC